MEAELKSWACARRFEPRLGPLDAEEAGLSIATLAFGPAGADAVEFLLAPNLGQAPMPLAKFASGGELSRVMLALKRLEAQRRGLPTMIFDEVDAGIGGEVARSSDASSSSLRAFHQVLCVTHLAQIAAFADRHFVVEK